MNRHRDNFAVHGEHCRSLSGVFVIPVEAGIQKRLSSWRNTGTDDWLPACAGMTRGERQASYYSGIWILVMFLLLWTSVPAEAGDLNLHRSSLIVHHPSLDFQGSSLIAHRSLFNLWRTAYKPSPDRDLDVNTWSGRPEDDIPKMSRPESGQPYVLRGQAKLEANDYYGAITEFSRAIELNPNLVWAYRLRAQSYMHIAEYRGAIGDLSTLLTFNPEDIVAYSNRSVAKLQLGDLKGALADITEAIHRAPTVAAAYNNRGQIKWQMRELESALEDTTEAIRLNPSFVQAYANRGEIKSALGDYRGAIRDCTKALALDSTYAHAYLYRAQAYLGLSDKAAARSDFEKAVVLDESLGEQVETLFPEFREGK